MGGSGPLHVSWTSWSNGTYECANYLYGVAYRLSAWSRSTWLGNIVDVGLSLPDGGPLTFKAYNSIGVAQNVFIFILVEECELV